MVHKRNINQHDSKAIEPTLCNKAIIRPKFEVFLRQQHLRYEVTIGDVVSQVPGIFQA